MTAAPCAVAIARTLPDDPNAVAFSLMSLLAQLRGPQASVGRVETIDELRKTSIDFYAAVRSLYRQRRAEEIRNMRPTSEQPSPTPLGASSPGTSTEAAQLPAQ